MWLRTTTIVSVLIFSACAVHSHAPFGASQAPTTAGSGVGLEQFFEWIDTFPRVELKDGMGQASVKISTKSDSAQKFFDQGLMGVHNFWDFETQRAFREAARHDPDCAMVWWGVMQSISRDAGFEKAAKEAFDKALSLSTQEHVTERERMWINASLPGEDYPKRMRELIRAYPDEVDAKLMLAVYMIFSTGDYRGHTQAERSEAQELIQQVIDARGEYAGAAHFAIHAFEDTAQPKDGLSQTRRLAELSPKSNHNVHMPGHVFYIIGDYPTAASYFSMSMDIDEQYMKKEGVTPVNNWDYAHNMAYLAVTYAEAGKLGSAGSLVDKIYSQSSEFNNDGLPAPPIGVSPAKRFYSSIYMHHALPVGPNIAARVGNFADAAKNVEKIESLGFDKNHDVDVDRVLKYFSGLKSFFEGMNALGYAQEFVEKDVGAACIESPDRACIKAAASSMDALEKVFKELKEDLEKTPSEDDRLETRVEALGVAALELHGALQAAKGDYEQSEETLRDAQHRARTLPYDEMSYYPRLPCVTSAEILLARARREAGKQKRNLLLYASMDAYDAHDEFYVNSGFTVFARARMYEFMSLSAVAAPLYRDLLHRWADSDGHLPHIVIAEDYVRDHALEYYGPVYEGLLSTGTQASASQERSSKPTWLIPLVVCNVAVGLVIGALVYRRSRNKESSVQEGPLLA